MTDDRLSEVLSTVGNLVRISFLVSPEETTAACEAACIGMAELLLLDPRRSPQSHADVALNCRLLKAFERFRLELDAIRREVEMTTLTPS